MIVDTDVLREAARTRGRRVFVDQWKGFFLVVTATPERLHIGFRTVEVRAFDPNEDNSPVSFELVQLVKAPGNPYPERISLGRAPNCDVVLRDPSVSKLHAHLRIRGIGRSRLELTDLNSSNGTHVNGHRALPNEPMVLDPGDTLKFGTVSARLADAELLYDFLR